MNAEQPLDISVVIPCLNEEKSLERCITQAKKGIEASGLSGEVLIADNGSTDRSRELSTSLGARVIEVRKRGCGAALQEGFKAARGTYIVMADADGSYDFGETPAFIAKLKEGYDLVNGNRFKGRIMEGAMPFLHRYLGNPFLSGLARILFNVPVGDLQCGLRAFRREALENIPFEHYRMEFHSEMLIKSKLYGLKMAELPITLYKDTRGTRPHLKTFRDGFAYLFMILECRIKAFNKKS